MKDSNKILTVVFWFCTLGTVMIILFMVMSGSTEKTEHNICEKIKQRNAVINKTIITAEK